METPSLDDLIWLFESEPVYPYPEEVKYWPYTVVVFEVTHGTATVKLRLHPADGEVRLNVAVDGRELIDLLLRRVSRLGVEQLPGRELLRIDLEDGFPGHSLFVRFKPDVSLGWEVGESAPLPG